MSVKMTKQHIFIIENNLQMVGQLYFHLSRRTTVMQDLLVQCQFSLVSDNMQLLRSIQGSIVPRYTIFTKVKAEVNIIYLGMIDPFINRNESQ